MKTILSIPVIAAKAIFEALTGHDDITEQVWNQKYKAQMLMMSLMSLSR